MKKTITCFLAMSWLLVARGQQTQGLRKDPEKLNKTQRVLTFNPDDRSTENTINQILNPRNNQTYQKVKVKQDKSLGLVTDVYRLYYKGVPVEESEIRIVNQNGKPKYILQDHANITADINVKPRISEAKALGGLLSKYGAKRYAWQDPDLEKALKERKKDPSATYYPKGELVILPESGKLAYKFEVFALEPAKRELVYADVQNGNMIKRVDLLNNELKLKDQPAAPLYPRATAVESSLNPTVSWMKVYDRDFLVETAQDPQNQNYFMKNLGARIDIEKIENYIGTVPIDPEQFNTTDEFLGLGDYRPKTDFAFRVAEKVSLGIRTIFNYFMSEFDRWGFDGAWSPMKAYVTEHALAGSFYDRESGLFFPFDPGITNPDITVGPELQTVYHEFAHAFTLSESGLIGGIEEPAMLNEALSDIWSYTVSNHFLKINPPPANDPNPGQYKQLFGNIWITSSGNQGFQDYYFSKMHHSVVRNAKDPNSNQYPAFYKGKYWDDNSTDEHFNSTVISHWYFLLSEGGSIPLETNPANIINIQGLGIENAAKIIYRTTTNFLGSTTDFHSFALQTVLASKILFGENAAEVDEVIKAWKAVGIEQLDFGSNQPCVPPADYDPHFYIKNFSMANIQNSKPNDFVGGYRDYTYLTIEAAPGFLYDVKIDAIKKPYFPEPLYWTIWIDVNSDGTFDASEKAGSGFPGVNSKVVASAYPKGKKLTLRVVLSKNKDAAACPGVQEDVNGKDRRYVEDYSIIVQEYCEIKNGISQPFAKQNPQFIGINFKNFKLMGCEEGPMFDHNVSQNQYFFDASNYTLRAGKAYSLTFDIKPSGLPLAPADQGPNQFSSNCQTQAPSGFSLGDTKSDSDPDTEDSGSLGGSCPTPGEDKEEFSLCLSKFRVFFWIDFNRNGVFETNEKYGPNYDKSTNTYYVNFTVPKWATTLSGYTIMRTYAYAGNGALYDADPCGNGINGYPPNKYDGETVLAKAGMDIGLYLENDNPLANFAFLQTPNPKNEEPSPSSAEASLDPVSLNLYPNPATSQVDISVKGTGADNFTLELYNSEGMRLLVQQPWDGRALDVSKYPNGIYVLMLRREREIYSQKLIIQR